MKKVLFFEKPGCKGNAKQKAMLEEAGYELEVHSILKSDWDPDELRTYFGELPVAEWFNWKSPKVKSGEVDPLSFCAADALALMIQEPLFIRRPLIKFGEQRMCGFAEGVQQTLGILKPTEDMESCQMKSERCD